MAPNSYDGPPDSPMDYLYEQLRHLAATDKQDQQLRTLIRSCYAINDNVKYWEIEDTWHASQREG